MDRETRQQVAGLPTTGPSRVRGSHLALRKSNARGVDTNLRRCDIGVRGESPVDVLRRWLPLPYVAVDLRELQEWFEPDEFQVCPHCVERAAITIERSGAVLCFHCGFIRWRGGETSIEELLRSQLPVEAHGETASASPGVTPRKVAG